MARLTGIVFLLLALAACTRTGGNAPAPAVQAPPSQAQIYLLRGGGGIFSYGMDEIGARLSALGIANKVVGFSSGGSVAKTIIAARRAGNRKPIILIGHSLGANQAVNIAQTLSTNGIRVNLLVTFAATRVNIVPRNVRRATNYYFRSGGWGEPVRPGRGFRGRLSNVDASRARGIHHFNVDEAERYQRQVVAQVRRLVGTRRRASSQR